MRRDVAEVQVGGETAGGLGLGPVALIQVSIEPVIHESLQGVPGGRRTSANGRSRNRVVDGQRRQCLAAARQYRDVSGRPLSSDGVRDRWGLRERFRERVLERDLGEMADQIFLQESPERVGGRELSIGGGHGQQPVAVDCFKTNRDLGRCRVDHRGQKERRKIIGHDDCCIGSESLQQAASGPVGRLHVGVVGDAAPFEGGLCRGHAVGDEPVEPVARPGVFAPERLENNELNAEMTRPFRRPLQTEVEPHTA